MVEYAGSPALCKLRWMPLLQLSDLLDLLMLVLVLCMARRRKVDDAPRADTRCIYRARLFQLIHTQRRRPRGGGVKRQPQRRLLVCCRGTEHLQESAVAVSAMLDRDRAAPAHVHGGPLLLRGRRRWRRRRRRAMLPPRHSERARVQVMWWPLLRTLHAEERESRS